MTGTDAIATAKIGGGTVVVCVGDLTRQEVGAVVNAANEHLQHGGGVAAALARAGGPTVQRESDDYVAVHGPVRPGTAAVTSGGALPADHIVHVVGPRYRRGQDNAGLLAEAVTAALDAADAAGVSSVALPAISAGIFGYPAPEAGRVIAVTACAWLAEGARGVAEIRLVGFDTDAARHFADGLPDGHRA
jgi:O-acetyl-ADP-ribose deacetylase